MSLSFLFQWEYKKNISFSLWRKTGEWRVNIGKLCKHNIVLYRQVNENALDFKRRGGDKDGNYRKYRDKQSLL